jgi:phosphoglycolate phosphatase
VGDLRRLIVFDLDGTLVDSRRDLADAANALILERGGQPLREEAIGRMVGEGARVLVERALTAAGRAVDAVSLPRFLELYDERLLNTTTAYPGIPEALAALASHANIAVLTNKPLAPSLRILEALGLSRNIAATIGGDGPFPKKPAPASLRHLMETFGAPPPATAMVGDSWIDWETARAAGTAICLARYGFGYHGVEAVKLRGDEGVVDEPSEIAPVLRRLLDI